MSKEQKLREAQELLRALGLPKKQYNQRSAWVFLALANIRPEDDWGNAQAPMLPTVDIMQFIREHYGQDYKPNSRETIRRQTLHQFEQARIVDRNRDDPSRPTNSKDNNYSLNQPIIDVLMEYPNAAWQQKIEEFKEDLHNLQELYQRKLDMEKIPVRLPSGQEIKLSPGKHNQLHADIVHEFCPRFIGESGLVLYIGDTASSRSEGGKLLVLEATQLEGTTTYRKTVSKPALLVTP
ncbi:MAG: BsuBI/PstI family type II restriction endonuclease [Pseudomonadota bacterium]|nr:BsuBI/PstI family type II restriction endonuclease [Pseudomonadota bacterium]